MEKIQEDSKYSSQMARRRRHGSKDFAAASKSVTIYFENAGDRSVPLEPYRMYIGKVILESRNSIRRCGTQFATFMTPRIPDLSVLR